MTDEIIFYHNPQSRSSMAHWMLEEVGAAYRVMPIDWAKADHKAPAYLAINPMGKIPAIVHDGVVVTETAAIIAYLADAFPGAGLMPPAGSPQRGAVYRWLFFGAGCVEPAMLDTLSKRAPPENKMAAGYGSYEDVLATLKGALEKTPYLTGDTFTAADLYVGSSLNWMGMFGAPGIKGDPMFDAYVARCIDRPAYRRANGVA